MLPVPYITVAEADLINNSTEWTSASEPEKLNALSWGRIYLDASYYCGVIDPTDPGDTIKYANAVLGEYSIQGTLYPDAGGRVGDKVTTEETVIAGSVEVTEKFAVNSSGDTISVDPFPNITALLSQAGCTYSIGSRCGTASIVRAR